MIYCGWILAVIFFVSYINTSVKLDKERELTQQLNQDIENLKDTEYVQKQKRLMDAQLQSLNNIHKYESIKVPRIPLGNLVRAFKSDYVWLQIKDLFTLEITDGSSTATVKCTPEARKQM